MIGIDPCLKRLWDFADDLGRCAARRVLPSDEQAGQTRRCLTGLSEWVQRRTLVCRT